MDETNAPGRHHDYRVHLIIEEAPDRVTVVASTTTTGTPVPGGLARFKSESSEGLKVTERKLRG